MFIIFVVLVLGILQLLMRWLLLDKEDRKARITDTKGDSYYYRGSALFVIVIIGITIVSFFGIFEKITIQGMYLVSLTLVLIFRGFLEWKYLRETKQHHMTLIILGILILFSLFFFSLK
ncbi:hypothetical protein AMS62_09995 [Bacillus sp. FJAT-18019]|nr:hypothetical protein AMS62_09995 [Bacillus sp. FJAT-18019]